MAFRAFIPQLRRLTELSLSLYCIGVARILSAGVHFFTTQQKLLKIDSCSGLGVHFVSCGGALTHFSCKLGLKKFFFTALGGAGAPTAPPGYAYVLYCAVKLTFSPCTPQFLFRSFCTLSWRRVLKIRRRSKPVAAAALYYRLQLKLPTSNILCAVLFVSTARCA